MQAWASIHEYRTLTTGMKLCRPLRKYKACVRVPASVEPRMPGLGFGFRAIKLVVAHHNNNTSVFKHNEALGHIWAQRLRTSWDTCESAGFCEHIYMTLDTGP